MKGDLPERTFLFARRVIGVCQVLDGTPGGESDAGEPAFALWYIRRGER